MNKVVKGKKGKAQFFFGMKNTATASPDNDNGIEADSHDNSSMTTFRSHPVLYNFTILGNGKATPTADNRGLAGANFKEGAEGELYNSIFANFKNGINLAASLTGVTYNAWHNWRNVGTTTSPNTNTVATANSLKIKCNTILMNSATTNSKLPWVANMFMMCQRIGRPPISTMGFGRNSVSSLKRVPMPPARMTAFILIPFLQSWGVNSQPIGASPLRA